MKKLLLILSLLSFLIYGCDDKKEENQKVEIIKNQISQEEKEKKIKERYEDFNQKSLELYQTYFNFLINFYNEEKTDFSIFTIKQDVRKNESNFTNKINLENIFNIDVHLTDEISFNEKLEQQGILAKIERRINYPKFIYSLPISEKMKEYLNSFRMLFNAVKYVYFYEDGRNINEYIVAPFTKTELSPNGYKLQFKGFEGKSEYLQKNIKNPLFIGTRTFTFKGFSMVANDNKNGKLVIEPFDFSLNISEDEKLNAEINNMNISIEVLNKKFFIKVDKIEYKAEDIAKRNIIDSLIGNNQKYLINGINFLINGKNGNIDKVEYIDNSIIKNNKLDFDYSFIFEAKEGIVNLFDSKNNNYEIYKIKLNAKIPNLDKNIINHLNYFELYDNKAENKKEYQSLKLKVINNYLDKINYNLNFSVEAETSLGNVAANIQTKLNLPVEKLLYNENGSKRSKEEYNKLFDENFNLVMNLKTNEKFLELQDIKPYLEKYKIDKNQGNFIIEVKKGNLYINNTFIHKLKIIDRKK